MSTPLVLSLGAGVQSTTLALLADRGEIPRPGLAIFADTGWEPAEVYAHLDRLEQALSFPVVRVRLETEPDIRQSALDGFGVMPMTTAEGQMLARQCTDRYKLGPIKAEVRRMLGAATKANGRPGRVPQGRVARMQIGISWDEIRRMKDSPVGYIVHEYPLVGPTREQSWTRHDCQRWLERHWPHPVPRSACIGCPLHSAHEWAEMRDRRPHEWVDAVEFDRAIRSGPMAERLGTKVFLHPRGLPLDRVPLGVVEGQRSLDFGCSPFGCEREGES